MKCDACQIEMSRVYDFTDGNQLCQCIVCKTVVVVTPDAPAPVAPDEATIKAVELLAAQEQAKLDSYGSMYPLPDDAVDDPGVAK